MEFPDKILHQLLHPGARLGRFIREDLRFHQNKKALAPGYGVPC